MPDDKYWIDKRILQQFSLRHALTVMHDPRPIVLRYEDPLVEEIRLYVRYRWRELVQGATDAR